MDRKIEALEIKLADFEATSSKVSDLHRVKFTPVEKLVEKADTTANFRSKILSRPPRQAIRK